MPLVRPFGFDGLRQSSAPGRGCRDPGARFFFQFTTAVVSSGEPPSDVDSRMGLRTGRGLRTGGGLRRGLVDAADRRPSAAGSALTAAPSSASSSSSSSSSKLPTSDLRLALLTYSRAAFTLLRRALASGGDTNASFRNTHTDAALIEASISPVHKRWLRLLDELIGGSTGSDAVEARAGIDADFLPGPSLPDADNPLESASDTRWLEPALAASEGVDAD
mmetsp:Transcript_67436/g.184913  ORF Transcript_67436/g.184913 Transcript_67436/m.184913 type:complete len:220 (-) Transcript_67436:128-787(-)